MSSESENIITVDTESALLVEGIEDWINSLLPIDSPEGDMLRMIDRKTKAIYIIRRIK